jgi:hypothetical protein
LGHNPQARDEGIGHDHAVQQNAGQSLRSDNLSCGSERHLAASGLGIPAVKRIKVNRKQNAHICIEEHQGLNNLPVAILAGLHQSSLHINRNRYSLLAHFISEFGTENKQMHHKSSLPAPYNS